MLRPRRHQDACEKTQSVVEKRMLRRDAAQQLALTERQTKRSMNRFRESWRCKTGKPWAWTPR
ncbi:hypothetical protein QTV06_003978 [Enterobacter ludwigii]|nr:hypothetical protein [Enterobacter ludwigii]